MRVSVFINDEAGGETDAGTITRAIGRHGHEIVRLLGNGDGLERLLENDADVVVAGGGDGTIASVARLMAGRTQPLAVLPLGTANNIADSLGCNVPLDALIAHWRDAPVRRIDLGRVSGPFGERHFLESVGAGLVAEGIAMMSGRPMSDALPPSWRIDRALDGYLDALANAHAPLWTLHVDGADVQDEFLLVEILNMRSIGPNIVLSEHADPTDGQLTLVAARTADRQPLMDYLRMRIAGGEPPLSLSWWPARDVVFGPGAQRMHIDDDVVELEPDARVSVSIDPAAVRVLWGPASS